MVSITTARETRVPGWRRWLPVVVLLVAIAAQAILMVSANADRQSGSGFAMFSSLDFAGSRVVRVDAVAGGEAVQVEPPPALVDDFEQLLITPTDRLSTDVAMQLRAMGWTISDGVASAGGELSFDRVTVQVRGLTSDGRVLGSQVLAMGESS